MASDLNPIYLDREHKMECMSCFAIYTTVTRRDWPAGSQMFLINPGRGRTTQEYSYHTRLNSNPGGNTYIECIARPLDGV